MALMESGISALKKLQLVKETTALTEVQIATVLWRGKGVIEDKSELKISEEDIALLVGVDRSYFAKYLAGLAMDSVEATFEQFPYLLEAGIKKLGTGVADGGGTGKVYAYPLPTTAKQTPQTYDGQGGDDAEVEFVTGGFAEGVKLSGKAGESWMMSGDWLFQRAQRNVYTATTIAFVSTGKHITDSANGLGGFKVGDTIAVTGTTLNNTTFTVATVVGAGDITVTETVATEAAGASVTLSETFTGSIAVPTVEEMLFGNTALYIDAVGGSFGGTIKSHALLGADLDLKTGLYPVFTNGQLTYVDIGFDKRKFGGTLNVTFRHLGVATAEKAAWRAQTARKIRLNIIGTALTTAATYTYKTCNVDLVGKWTSFGKLGEQDGDDIMTGVFKVLYNATAATAGNITVVNQLTALP